MKTLFVILAGIIFAQSLSFSQNSLSLKDNKVNDDFFSWSYELGYGVTSYSEIMNGNERYGHIGGVELSLHGKSLNEFFISYDFQKFVNTRDYSPLTLGYLSTGPRIHVAEDKSFYIEGAVVTYFLNGSHYQYYFADPYGSFSFHRSLYMGFLFGFGKEIELNRSISTALTIKFNGIFAPRGVVFSCGLFSKFSFNSKETEDKTKDLDDNSRWAVTLLGGANNPDFFVNRDYMWGMTYGVEAALKTSKRLETTLSVLNNRYEYLYQHFAGPFGEYHDHNGYNTFDVLLGERVYFNKDAVSSYVNLGGGLYSAYVNRPDYYYNQDQLTPYFGVYFGTGIAAHLYKTLSLTAGSTINLIISGDSFLGSHLKLTGGLRYDL